eukprot:9258250-Pyramimonas_sp.AAC.1
MGEVVKCPVCLMSGHVACLSRAKRTSLPGTPSMASRARAREMFRDMFPDSHLDQSHLCSLCSDAVPRSSR